MASCPDRKDQHEAELKDGDVLQARDRDNEHRRVLAAGVAGHRATPWNWLAGPPAAARLQLSAPRDRDKLALTVDGVLTQQECTALIEEAKLLRPLAEMPRDMGSKRFRLLALDQQVPAALSVLLCGPVPAKPVLLLASHRFAASCWSACVASFLRATRACAWWASTRWSATTAWSLVAKSHRTSIFRGMPKCSPETHTRAPGLPVLHIHSIESSKKRTWLTVLAYLNGDFQGRSEEERHNLGSRPAALPHHHNSTILTAASHARNPGPSVHAGGQTRFYDSASYTLR